MTYQYGPTSRQGSSSSSNTSYTSVEERKEKVSVNETWKGYAGDVRAATMRREAYFMQPAARLPRDVESPERSARSRLASAVDFRYLKNCGLVRTMQVREVLEKKLLEEIQATFAISLITYWSRHHEAWRLILWRRHVGRRLKTKIESKFYT